MITDTEGGFDDVGPAILLKERMSVMTFGDPSLHEQQRRALFKAASDNGRYSYVVGVIHSDCALVDIRPGDQMFAKDISGFKAMSDAEFAFEAVNVVRGEHINPSAIRRVE